MLHKQPNNKVLLTMKKFFSLILAIGTSLSVFAFAFARLRAERYFLRPII